MTSNTVHFHILNSLCKYSQCFVYLTTRDYAQRCQTCTNCALKFAHCVFGSDTKILSNYTPKFAYFMYTKLVFMRNNLLLHLHLKLSSFRSKFSEFRIPTVESQKQAPVLNFENSGEKGCLFSWDACFYRVRTCKFECDRNRMCLIRIISQLLVSSVS